MKRQTDAEWLTFARQRYALEGPSFDVAPDLDSRAEPSAPRAACLRCPSCETPPALLPFPAYVLATPVPLQHCSGCHGVWAPAGATSAGILADADAHPALRAAPAPPRCRACFGYIMPDGACTKCKKHPPAIDCPSCAVPMARAPHGKLRLDHCAKCGGTWYETGELPKVFAITTRPSLVERAVEYRDNENAAMLGGILGFPLAGDGNSVSRGGVVAAGLGLLSLFFRFRI